MNYDLEDISPGRRAADRIIIRSVEQVLSVLASHWLFILNSIHYSIVGLAFLVPVMMYVGLTGIASTIFGGYHALCHQLPYRSDFLFGYQVAFCQRDAAIYASMALGGTVFALVRDRVRSLPWQLYLVLIFPMAVDGFTQLFGWRESNWALRTITGTLFGLSSVWLAYPYLQVGMRQLLASLEGRDSTDRG